jgi:hypothetical protein
MVEESDASFVLVNNGIFAFSLEDNAKRALAFEHVLLGHQSWIRAMAGRTRRIVTAP